MPNSFLSMDISSYGYVVPNGAAQGYTDILRLAYQAVATTRRLALYESQALLFSETSFPSSPEMLDQIHPSRLGYRQMLDQIMEIIGLRQQPQCSGQ